jgi:hypothetical protein
MLPSGSVKTKRAGKLLASIDFRAALFDKKSGGRYVDGDDLPRLLTTHAGRCAWDSDAMEHSCDPPPPPPSTSTMSSGDVCAGTFSDGGLRHELFLPSLLALQARHAPASAASHCSNDCSRPTTRWRLSSGWAWDGRTLTPLHPCFSTCCKCFGGLLLLPPGRKHVLHTREQQRHCANRLLLLPNELKSCFHFESVRCGVHCSLAGSTG